MESVPQTNEARVNGNDPKKLASRICTGAASLFFDLPQNGHNFPLETPIELIFLW